MIRKGTMHDLARIMEIVTQTLFIRLFSHRLLLF